MTPQRAPRLAVFGLGYVGAVSAACFAELGHRVIGVDVSTAKVDALNAGHSPVQGEGLEERVASFVASGRLSATEDAGLAVRSSDMAMICVGTPSLPSGAPDLTFVERVCKDVGSALPDAPPGFVVVVRSTVPPGTCEDLLVPWLESASGLTCDVDFHVCFNPEFLREGTSVRDFFDPPKTVVGARTDAGATAVHKLYGDLPGARFHMPLRVAELVKYVDNSFHAMKVAFANEVGALCKALDLDSHVLMECFCSDHKLNISTAYLRPGFAFGGSCLPKDLRSLTRVARHLDLHLPLLESILVSNEEHIRRAFELVVDLDVRRVALFGLAFKPGTDDLRESPLVALAERLLGRGTDLRIYDPTVALSNLHGVNRDFVLSRIPHLSDRIVTTPEAALCGAEAVVLGAVDEAAARVLGDLDGPWVIDLQRSRVPESLQLAPAYRGVAW